MNERAVTRARPDADVVVAQVTEISELMAGGRWIRGRTERKIALKWGVAVNVVQNRAAEARRLVQHAYTNLEELRGLILAQLEGIAVEQRRKEARTAVAALTSIAQIAGLIVTRHTDTRPLGPDKRLSPEQRREEIARIRAQLDEADALAVADMQALDVPGTLCPLDE